MTQYAKSNAVLDGRDGAPARRGTKAKGEFLVLLHGQIPIRFCQVPGQLVYELSGRAKASRFPSEDVAVAVAVRHKINQFTVEADTMER